MKKLLILGLLIFCASHAKADEQIDTTEPHIVNPSSTTYFRVGRLDLNRDAAIIRIELSGNNGVRAAFEYTGPTATNMIKVLNKANLTNNSLNRRVLTQLISDGKIDGSVSGDPD